VEGWNELQAQLDAAEIATRITSAARQSGNSEEQLKIKIINVLSDYFGDIVIDKARYEKAVKLSSGRTRRSDFLFGSLIIEFEPPEAFKGPTGGPHYKHAIRQAEELIAGEARVPEERERYFGIAIDGYRLGFVKFRRGSWVESAPLEVNAVTVMRLVEAIRGLERKALDVVLLVQDLGAQSDLARRLVPLFYSKLRFMKSKRTEVLFKDWRRVFTQVCSYSDRISNIFVHQILVEVLEEVCHTFWFKLSGAGFVDREGFDQFINCIGNLVIPFIDVPSEVVAL
jgi:hypothetical protein